MKSCLINVQYIAPIQSRSMCRGLRMIQCQPGFAHTRLSVQRCLCLAGCQGDGVKVPGICVAVDESAEYVSTEVKSLPEGTLFMNGPYILVILCLNLICILIYIYIYIYIYIFTICFHPQICKDRLTVYSQNTNLFQLNNGHKRSQSSKHLLAK